MNTDDPVVQTQTSNRLGLELSDAALAHLRKLLSKASNATAIRLTLNKTGCSGLSYFFDYIQEPVETDLKFTFSDLVVYVDHQFYPYLKGTQIDYVKEGLNHRFVFDNPNQKGQCGCGESFTIE